MEKYDNLGMVGEGSYGMVMKCKHKETGQIVAIKKFLESEDDKMVKKIAMREVRMLRKLRHENLVNLIEVFRRRKRLYLVFEFVDHTVLDDLEKYPNGLNEMTVRKILWQVLRGVEFCHSHNIIHRDIKPENILNSRSGVIKICDFGFARTLAAHGEIYTDYVATRWYRAPELLVGDTKYGRGIDIWAVGCLAGEMLIGRPIFPGRSDVDQLYRVISCLGNLSPRHREIFQRNPLFAGMRLPEVKEFEPLEKKFPKFSSEVIDIMKLSLRLDPNDRPSSSALLRHEFFRKDHFEEKVIPEIRARIQKEVQQNQMVRKSLAEKQQQKKEEEERKKKKMRENEEKLPSSPSSNTKLQEINKNPPRTDKPPLQKKDSNLKSPQKESLANINTRINKTPPSEETKKRKDPDKDRKLPAAVKQDNTIVTGPPKLSPKKQQASKEDFSTPRTLIPKVTNESMNRDNQKSMSTDELLKNLTTKSPRETQNEKKHVTINVNVDSPSTKRNKSPPPVIATEKSPSPTRQPKASILKNSSQTLVRGSKESVSFERKSFEDEQTDKRSVNIKPDQSAPLLKSISDTSTLKEAKSSHDKLSFSNSDSLTQMKNPKPQKECSPTRKPETPHSRKDTDIKSRPTSSKQPAVHIPPIQPQPGLSRTHQQDADIDPVKQFPSQGIRILDKPKKSVLLKESFPGHGSFEKSMYGGTSSFEKMMMSMSGSTSISHPAIKKSNPNTHPAAAGPSSSPYTQSISPYSQQFGHHFSRDEAKPSGSSLPLWSTNTSQSYYDKHLLSKNANQDGRGSDIDHKSQKIDPKAALRHHRHNNKEERTSKFHEEKLSNRTKLPDLLGRGTGMSGSRADDFPGFKPAGYDQQRRTKPKKFGLMSIPNYDSTGKQNPSTSNDPTSQLDSNFPSVQRK